MLSGLRRHDLSWRVGEGHRAFAPRSRHRKSVARQREPDNLAFHRVIYQIETRAGIRLVWPRNVMLIQSLSLVSDKQNGRTPVDVDRYTNFPLLSFSRGGFRQATQS